MLFVECLNGGKRLLYDFPVSTPAQGAIGGDLFLGIAWLASPEVLGLGNETIQRALEGGTIVWSLVLGENTHDGSHPQRRWQRGDCLTYLLCGSNQWLHTRLAPRSRSQLICRLGLDRAPGRRHQYSTDGFRLRVRAICWAHQRTLPFAELHQRLLAFGASECHSHTTLAIQEITGATRYD